MSTALKKVVFSKDINGNSLLLQGERVIAFGDLQAPADAEVVDCANTVIAPGRVNAHTHVYSGLVPLGMPPPKEKPQNFLQILERIWWRLDRALDADSLRAAARYYVAHALMQGTTTLVDHHESPNFIEGSLDVLADVCQELGLRAILCYGATERNGGVDEAKRGLAECERFATSNTRPLMRGLVGLHASFTVSDRTIRDAAALARQLGSALHLHLAEDEADVNDGARRGYAGPLGRLNALGGVSQRTILAHGVYLKPREVVETEDFGCWLVQNPRSNKGNAVGYPKALYESERVALGTDGYLANMVEEARVLEQEAIAHNDKNWRVRPEASWKLIGEFFGQDFAPLDKGCAADVVALEGSLQGQPRHVVVGGRLVVKDGRLLTGDREEIEAEAQKQAPKLWERMAQY